MKKILPYLLLGGLFLTAVYFFFYPLHITKTTSSSDYILEYKLVGGIAGSNDELKIDKNFVYIYRGPTRKEQSGKLNLFEASKLNSFLRKYGVINFSSPDKKLFFYDAVFSSLRFQGNNKSGLKNEEVGEISKFSNEVIFRIKLIPFANSN